MVVNINGSSISLRAEHPAKTLELSFPLRHAIEPSRSTYTISTFGITFTLRKWDLQHVWDDLHPEAWPRTRSSAVWWEMKQKHEAAVNEVNKMGASVKWCVLAISFKSGIFNWFCDHLVHHCKIFPSIVSLGWKRTHWDVKRAGSPWKPPSFRPPRWLACAKCRCRSMAASWSPSRRTTLRCTRCWWPAARPSLFARHLGMGSSWATMQR